MYSDHRRRLDDMAHPLMCHVVVVVVGVQRWLGAVEPVMVVVGGGDTVEGDGEDFVIRWEGSNMGGDWVKRV